MRLRRLEAQPRIGGTGEERSGHGGYDKGTNFHRTRRILYSRKLGCQSAITSV
jgi:hypothetical protein